MRFMQLLDRTLSKKSQNVAKGEKVRQMLLTFLLKKLPLQFDEFFG